ncbi:RNA polymerase sigma factor SigJ [Chromobacterium amazonense]|uniref:RNA polymerase sigma factor SigJ n=1 Tax=Chromobacterium amazonense TaxID=1382803 RepID=UPI0031F635B5
MHLPVFMEHRSRLLALAYRMLGSRADAQDVVQDAWLRWSACKLDELDQPAAYLTRITTHLCLDKLRSAHTRREQYIGICLPEPLSANDDCMGPEGLTEKTQLVSYGWLLALQRLGPLERAAFLLREVFDVDYEEISQIVQRSPLACRQLVSRSKRRLQQEPSSLLSQPKNAETLSKAFIAALESGNTDELAKLLAEDVIYMADGGGQASALLAPLTGARPVSRLIQGIWKNAKKTQIKLQMQVINGMPGILFWQQDRLYMSVAIASNHAEQISALYVMRNPNKLTHLADQPCKLDKSSQAQRLAQ